MQTKFRVIGMTCGHCEKRVSDEVGRVPGVDSASADHLTAIITVTSEAEPGRGLISDAVEDAGYTLVEG